jgi:hypothetical protein
MNSAGKVSQNRKTLSRGSVIVETAIVFIVLAGEPSMIRPTRPRVVNIVLYNQSTSPPQGPGATSI